jgi:hypothetical protein
MSYSADTSMSNAHTTIVAVEFGWFATLTGFPEESYESTRSRLVVSAEVLTRTDGVMLVLFSTPWRLEGFQRDNPDVKLGSLVAAEG